MYTHLHTWPYTAVFRIMMENADKFCKIIWGARGRRMVPVMWRLWLSTMSWLLNVYKNSSFEIKLSKLSQPFLHVEKQLFVQFLDILHQSMNLLVYTGFPFEYAWMHILQTCKKGRRITVAYHSILYNMWTIKCYMKNSMLYIILTSTWEVASAQI